MIRSGLFTWGTPQWAPLVAVIITLGLLLTATCYWGDPAKRMTRLALACLKILAVMTLALCILEPLTTGTRPVPRANSVVLLVDNSQSMQIRGPSGTFASAVSKALDHEASWRQQLERWFRVRTFSFSDRVHREDETNEMQFDGTLSHLHTAIKTLGARHHDDALAGIILFTDGNATDSEDAVGDTTESSPCPVYVVRPDADPKGFDIAIDNVQVSRTDFEAAPVTVRANIKGFGLHELPNLAKVNVSLRDGNDEEVESTEVTFDGTAANQRVEFRFLPTDKELGFYQLHASLSDDRLSNKEITPRNNHRWLAIDRHRGPFRILYVSGRPNWELKFLRRALQTDDELALVGLVRIAKREPKFSFRDTNVGDSNPLFAGFSPDDEGDETYDEPVLLRLGVRDEKELANGFPNRAEDLFTYHGIVLDDLEANFFTPEQLALLRRFVVSRGGGLLQLGGQEAFGPGGFSKCALGDLSPVYATSQRATHGEKRFGLTREGLLLPWLRLRETEADEVSLWSAMPTTRTWNRVRDTKPGVSVLATGSSEGGEVIPLFVTQRFGDGRSAALLSGDMWRWAMHQKAKDPDDLAQAWRQMLRWLVADSPQRLRVSWNRDTGTPQERDIAIELRDAAFQPTENGRFTVHVTRPDGGQHRLAVEPGDEVGLYRATYRSDQEGGYRLDVRSEDAADDWRGEVTAGWAANPGSEEYQFLTANQAAISRIAQQTGGEVISLSELPELAARLPRTEVPQTETWTYPAWHQPAVLLLVIALLCTEWGVRRKMGAA